MHVAFLYMATRFGLFKAPAAACLIGAAVLLLLLLPLLLFAADSRAVLCGPKAAASNTQGRRGLSLAASLLPVAVVQQQQPTVLPSKRCLELPAVVVGSHWSRLGDYNTVDIQARPVLHSACREHHTPTPVAC